MATMNPDRRSTYMVGPTFALRAERVTPIALRYSAASMPMG
jgi:hypothetical protein